MLMLATLAYVALTFHASFALASMTHAVPTAAYSAWGEAAATLHTQVPEPMVPCCREQQCTTLVTAGPLLPTAHEPVAKSHYKVRAVTFQYPALILEAGGAVLAPVQNQRLPQHTHIYLSTARLRL